MSETARKLAERARATDNFPIWVPVLAPVGMALIAGYMVVAVIRQDAPQDPGILPDQASEAPVPAPSSLSSPEVEYLSDPITAALGAFRYMLTGDPARAPEDVSLSSLPVLRSWDDSLSDLSIVDYSREGESALVSLLASGPDGEQEFVRLEVLRQGEVWIVSAR